MGKLTINSVTECEGGGDYPVKLEAEIKNIGGGKKALNAKVVLPFKLDDSIKVGWRIVFKFVSKMCYQFQFLHFKKYYSQKNLRNSNL